MLRDSLTDPIEIIIVARVIEMKTLQVPTEFRRTVKAPAQAVGISMVSCDWFLGS
jgi:hypothetical protein